MKKKLSFLKAEPIRWKQFSRKKDAIFNSLGKEIIILTLTVPTLLFSTPDSASAQVVTNTDSIYLDEDTLQAVEVTASRLPLPMDQTARIVGIISQEDIECFNANSVNDLLKYVASVDVRQRGAFGIQTDISINGGTHDQILVLIDGVNVSSPHTGHLTTDLPLKPDDIERIEILEGASSRIFGTSAFSGAINIITKKNTKPSYSHQKWSGSIGLDAGSYGTINANASASYLLNRGFNRVGVSYSRSDGATHNSDFNKSTLFYNGGINHNNIDMNWYLGANLQNFGANTFYSGKYPNQYEHNQKYQGAISLNIKGDFQIKPSLFWLKAIDHYQLIKNTDFGENYHMTDVYGSTINVSKKWKLGTTLIAAEIRNEGILSTSLGKPLDSSKYVKVYGSKTSYTHKDNRTNISYFLEHNMIISKWSVSMGVMANMNTSIDHRLRLYPGIDICFNPSSEWKFYGSWNMAQRMPTFTDLYYKSPTQEGNVNIKPEETNEIAFAAHFRGKGLRVESRIFYRHDSPLIDWVLTPEDISNGYTTYHVKNFKLDKYGFNIKTDLLFNELFNKDVAINSLHIGYSYLNQNRFDNIKIYASSYALDYLRHKLILTLNSKISKNIYADVSFRCNNRKGGFVKYIPFVDNDGNVDYNTCFQKYKTYSLLSLKLRWINDIFELYAQADNITNVKYYDIGNVVQPGIWIMCGIKYKL